MSINLFGTDGIRGKVNTNIVDEEEAINRLIEHRELSPPVLRLIGESMGRSAEFEPNKKSRVVVGWDDRPTNNLLANHLTVGLNLADFEVVHIGLCATPLLHYATLSHDADFGCMITASHNPVEDSGLKIFSKYGYKTTPEFEQELSHNAIALSKEDREIDSIDNERLSEPLISHNLAEWSQINHPDWLSRRYQILADLIQRNISQAKNIHQPLLIDSSKGVARFWLANWLSSNGVQAVEVSDNAMALNDNCGAGDFSPTQKWTFAEAQKSPHMLINQLPKSKPGTLVAAALDGDGDRCLLIEATQHGFRVVDGDRIADAFLNSVTNSGKEWNLAASIESDISLTTNLDRYPMQVNASETAVGDRWLSFKLSDNQNNEYIINSTMPSLLGVEDSGHIVLASPHPNHEFAWTLVGDGAMTLVAYLLASTRLDESKLMDRGWKQRQSVNDVDRGKWNGNNKLSDLIEKSLLDKLSSFNSVSQWHRTTIPGEPNLMLIKCLYGEAKLSIGVRNSGTQAKISVSARLEYGGNNVGIQEAINEACDLLGKHMINR